MHDIYDRYGFDERKEKRNKGNREKGKYSKDSQKWLSSDVIEKFITDNSTCIPRKFDILTRLT